MMFITVFGVLGALSLCGHSVNGDCNTSGVENLQRDEILQEIPMDSLPEFSCENENIDAAILTADKKTLLFKGEYYWRLNDSLLAPGYPRPISKDWIGLPGNLDAAVTIPSGRTLFFKGPHYWSFTDREMDAGYPKLISDGFCGLPNDIEAATLWSHNGFIYFFKGNQYWRFDGGENLPSLHGPRPIEYGWINLNGPVDAALRWKNGITYFYKGGYYHRYHDNHGLQGGVEMHGAWGLSCNELRKKIFPLEADTTNHSPAPSLLS